MKYWHFFIICFLIGTTATAQYRFGITAGPNLSSLHHKKSVPFNTPVPRVGFSVGGILDMKIDSHFGLQTELAYTLSGAKGPNEAVDLQSVVLPLTVTYAPLKWLKVGVGSHGGVLIESNNILDFRTVDGGVHAGLEFMLQEHLSIRVRNYFGLVYDRFDSNDMYQYIDEQDVIDIPAYKINRSNIFQLTVQYYFADSK
jgi:hypothetical protein